MKKINKSLLFTIVILQTISIYSQQNETANFIEFNDRKNILHGVYLGLNAGFGQIQDKHRVIIGGAKLAYVANRKMELGVAVNIFQSPLNELSSKIQGDFEVSGVYGGFHIENVFFNEKKIKFSVPILLGLGYIEGSGDFSKNSDMMGVLESGVNALLNINKYIQIEGGIKYRFSSPIDPIPTVIDNINGFSIGFGIKAGVFNLGKNRYNKKTTQ